MTSNWTARYPDLTGKTVIVSGDSPRILEISHALAANAALVAIVAADRVMVERSVEMAEHAGADVFGLTADPSSPDVWARIAQHIEQRLGPIDVVVAAGGPALRQTIGNALLPDMAARRRGVLVEVDKTVDRVEAERGVRRRGIEIGSAIDGPSDTDVAAAVLLCASDLVTSPWVLLVFGGN